MNNEHVKGTVNEIKGRIKEDIGHLAGSEKTSAEGVVDQVKGKVQKVFGDIKDKVKETVDKQLRDEKKH